MPALNAFTDFLAATPSSYFSSPKEFKAEYGLRNFRLAEKLWAQNRVSLTGQSVKDIVYLEDPNAGSFYQPGDPIALLNPQVSTTAEVFHRFMDFTITWMDQEVALQATSELTDAAYKRILPAKVGNAWASFYNMIERAMLRTASYSEMEIMSGKYPNSIPAALTTDGLSAYSSLTFQGINRTTKSNWRNQVASYTYATPYDAATGVAAGMDSIGQLVEFMSPPSVKQYFAESDLSGQMIRTNREGQNFYRRALRASNDYTRVGAQDLAYNGPVFGGIPVEAAAVYDDTDGAGTGFFTSGQPGYHFINTNFVHLVYVPGKFMEMMEPERSQTQKDTNFQRMRTWANFFWNSLRRHGYLYAA